MTAPHITPLPVPPDAGPLLLFGGLFDPPHWAHVELAIAARDAALGPSSWLVYVPAARSPHKPDGPVAGDDDRLAMLRLALEGRERTAIWTDELDRADAEPSYWVVTLERARALRPDAELRFLVGADQAVAFHRWRDRRRVLELARPVVMLRDPAPSLRRLRELLRETGEWTDAEIDWWCERVVPHEAMRISSTELRERLGTSGGDDAMLDDRVRAYIDAHHLYADRS